MKLLDEMLAAKNALFSYFGYKEDWRVYAAQDYRRFWWSLDEDEENVTFADKKGTLDLAIGGDEEALDACYTDEVLRDRFLPQSVYRKDDYTMILVDTHTDGNKFLAVFDNKREVKP